MAYYVRPPDFMPGYPNPEGEKYHNIGFLSSPYPGKKGGGDWGPIQKHTGVYYTPYNPTYYTPLDPTPCCQEATFRRRNIPIYRGKC